jgi:TetR/AcrR family transcriptional regulator, fatty acid metabolism regulator protein
MNNHSARTRGKSNGRRAASAKKKDAAPAPPEGKRGRILDAAIKVFAAEGFYNAKVSQIAHEAGVADGTIYLYFKSKDDLLINLFEDRMERVNANLREAIDTESTAQARLRRIVKLHLELVEQNRDMAEVISVELRQSSKFIREYANPKFGEFLRTIAGAVVEGQRTGELRTGIDPYVFARALFGALDEIALAWLVKHPGPNDKNSKSRAGIELPKAAEQLGDLFIDGLLAR